MSGPRTWLLASVGILLGGVTVAAERLAKPGTPEPPAPYGFGAPPAQAELDAFFAIPPSGRGLPPGRGDYSRGREVYTARCASCHGSRLEGWGRGMTMPPELAAMGDGRLVGGRGSLQGARPMFTVESYWPFATTLWDYTKRAMPQTAPGSLTNDEVYAVVAYMLGEAGIVSKSVTLDAASLRNVKMPNRDGFIPDRRPEPELSGVR